MVVSLLSIALNAGLNWILTFKLGMGHRGLALSTSVIAMTNFLLLYAMMRHYAGRLETGVLLGTLAKLLVAGACLGVICWLGAQYFFPAGVVQREWWKLIGVTTTVVVAGSVFFVVAYLLRVAELHDLVDVFKRKLVRA
jgi:putative peptidoglycan lipid II flippase